MILRPMRRPVHTLMFCLVWLGGCDPIEAEDALAAADVDEFVDDDASLPGGPDRLGVEAEDPEAVVVATYTWYPGGGSVDMGPVNDRVCFLRGFQGRLESMLNSGEGAVRIYNGRWQLSGSIFDTTRVDAVCVPLDWYGQSLWYSIEYYVDGFDKTLADLGPTAGKVCFLTAVGGKFEGGGEVVQVYQSNGRWYLSAQSNQNHNASQNNLIGRARCVNNSAWISGPYNWQQGQPPVTMASVSDWICGLTRIAGKFEGGGENVEVWATGGAWTLGGNSQQAGVAASGYCL